MPIIASLDPKASADANRAQLNADLPGTEAAPPGAVPKDYFETGHREMPLIASKQAMFPRPFGVEIELAKTTLRDVSRIVQKAVPGTLRGSDADETDVYDAMNRRWEVKEDEPNIEIATPILRTGEDLATLQRLVRALAAAGAIVDAGTGVHVHVDADGIDARALTYLLALVARHEPYVFAALDVEKTRRQFYCRPLKLSRVRSAVRARPESMHALAAAFRDNFVVAKFVGMNLEPIFSRGGFGTVEFRYFNGSLEPHAIGCYVGYAMALMDHAARADALPELEGAAGLPELFKTVGLAPAHPVSRMLCDSLAGILDAATAKTPQLRRCVRADAYSGDAAMLLAMGVDPEELEAVLAAGDENADAMAQTLFKTAVSVFGFLPMDTTTLAFSRLRDVPAPERAQVAALAIELLDDPRFANEATAIFIRLCQVRPCDRAGWARIARDAPVAVLTRFAPKYTPPLTYVFSQIGMQKTLFPGAFQLAEKIKGILTAEQGSKAVRAKLQAVLDTACLSIDNRDLRGRIMFALLDFSPAQIKQLVDLTRPMLANLKAEHPDAYTVIFEAFCEAGPSQWDKYAERLQAVLSGPQAAYTLRALDRGYWDATEILDSDAPIVPTPAQTYVFA